MFNSKQKEIDRLNARCVELAQQLRDSNLENKQLKELRLEAVRNNTKILNVNRQQSKILHEIEIITTQNTYGNLQSNFDEIKELVNDYQSNH